MPRMPRHAAQAPEAPTGDVRRTPRHGRRAGTNQVREERREPVSLAGLGIAGVSRRRLALVAGTGLALWIAVGFAGQATDAARAADRAGRELAANTVVADRIAGLQDELDLVVQRRWFLQEARAYQLGEAGERPFTLDPAASALPPDAPGSPDRALGVTRKPISPLDSWLETLFGSSGG